MGNQQIVVDIVQKVCDVLKSFAFHYDEWTKQRFFGRLPPGFRMSAADWAYVQMCKQPVVELRFGLRYEQVYVLYDFLAIDNGQPLSAWFVATYYTIASWPFLYLS